MFLNKNRNEDIKGRTCADGIKNQNPIKKEDENLPTVATESVFISVAVDAHERQDMATFYIPGAYIHTKTDEDVMMFLEVVISELMAKLEPKIYRKFVITSSKGKPLLHVQKKRRCMAYYTVYYCSAESG